MPKFDDVLPLNPPAVVSESAEHRALADAIRAINDHERSYVTAALHLYRVEKLALYQYDEFPPGSGKSHVSFTAFTDAHCEGWGEQKIRKYIEAGRVVDALIGAGVERLPERESQARVLRTVPAGVLKATWEKVLARVDAGERLTAELIAEVVSGKTAAQRDAERAAKQKRNENKALPTTPETTQGESTTIDTATESNTASDGAETPQDDKTDVAETQESGARRAAVKATVTTRLSDMRVAVLRGREIEVKTLANGQKRFEFLGADRAAILTTLATLPELDDAPSLTIKFG